MLGPMRGVLALGACFVFACQSTTTATEPPTGPDAAGAESDVPCGPPPGRWVEGRDPPAYCVKEVTGTLQDEGSNPLAGVDVSVCGAACFSGKTDASGAFRVPVNARLPDGGYAFFAHARPRHASILLPLPKGPPPSLSLGAVVEVPALSEVGAALPADDGPGSVVRVGPISLGVPAATSWELSFEDAADDVGGRTVRFAKVALDRAPAFAAGAVLVYALAPFEAKAGKPVSLTLAETGGLPANAAVDILVMGALGFEAPNPGGLAEIAAQGHVSGDGASITTDPGQGIRVLTWIAVRARP